MSEATKSAALQHALVHHAGKAVSAEAVVTTAIVFDNFINATNAKAAPVAHGAGKATPAVDPAAAKAKLAAKAAAAKKAAAEAEAAAAEPEADAADGEAEPEAEGATKAEVSAAIQAMVDADLLDEATAILKKYKAASMSKLDPKYYDMVLAEATEAVGG